MRRALAYASLVVITASFAMADLAGMQQKAIERAIKTLGKSGDANERREAIRTLSSFEVPEVVAPLIAALEDPDPSVRRLAADGLWRVSEVAAPAKEALMAALEDPSPGVRVRAAAALEALGVEESELVAAREAGLGAELLRDRILAARDLVGFVPSGLLAPPVIEVAAAEAETSSLDLGESYLDPVDILERLVRAGDPGFVEPVMAAIEAGNPGRRWLLKGLADLEPKPADWNLVLVAQLGSARMEDRIVALDLLSGRSTGEAGVEMWIAPVTAALAVPETRNPALWALRGAGGYAAAAAPAIAPIVTTDPDKQNRERAADALGEIGDRSQAFPTETLRAVAEAALPALATGAVKDPDPSVRGNSIEALGQLWVTADEVLPTFLAIAADDPDTHNRFSALLRIRDLGTEAASAADELAAIAAADPDNRGVAEQAIAAIRDQAPSFDPTVTTGSADDAGSGAALAALRSAGIDFDPHSVWLALNEVDVEKVRLFLDAGIDPNERLDDVGMRPLHVLYFGSGCTVMSYPSPAETTTLTKLLIERGADPNIADDRGNTALKLAVMGCDGSVVTTLIEGGADMNATDGFGMTAFDLAVGISAFSGSDAPQALLDAGFRPSPEKLAELRKNYGDNPQILELLARASAAGSK
jgi:HEAT repeat protein